MRVPANVIRVQAPATHFGTDDRSVPCVIAGQAPSLALAIPLEEFVVEQVNFRVEGEVLVIDDPRITFDPLRSLRIDDALDVGFTSRPSDGIAVLGWDEFLTRQSLATHT